MQCGNPSGRFYADCVEDVLATCDLDKWVNETKDAEEDFDEVDDNVTIPEETETLTQTLTASGVHAVLNFCPCVPRHCSAETK